MAVVWSKNHLQVGCAMDIISQYSLIPYTAPSAEIPAPDRNLTHLQPKIPALTPGHRLLNDDTASYFSETADSSPSGVYTSASRFSAIESSKIGSLIDIYA